MPRLDKSRVQDQDLFSVRDAKSSNVQRVYIPHDTIIGVDGFQASDLTVLGDLIVCGSINGITQTPTSSYVLTTSYFLVSAPGNTSEGFPNYRMLVPMNNVSSSESFYNEAERLTISVVPTSASNDDKNGYIQFYESGSQLAVFAASKSLRYDDRVRNSSGGNLLEALHVEGQVKARNVPYVIKTGAGTYEWKRIINLFPYNGSMTATVAGLESTSNQFFSRNVDAQFQNGTFGMYMMFLGQFATVNSEGGVRSLDRFNSHPDFAANSTPFTLPIENPVMKGWIRTHSGTLNNINVVIGYYSRNMSDPLETDRPQRPSGNEGYAYLRFFTGSAGSLTDSYTSRDGARGLRPYAADTSWMLVASGSGTTTQVTQSTGLTVNSDTDYYFELTLNSAGSFSAYVVDENGTTGSATINTGITSGTNLGFLANVRAVSGSASARIQRGLGIYFMQFEL